MPPVLLGLFGVLGRVWTLVSSFKLFWAVLRNWTELKERAEKLEGIVQRMSIHGYPEAADVKELLQDMIFLFQEGFIDIPGVDEEVLVRQLQQVELNLTEGLKAPSKKRDLDGK